MDVGSETEIKVTFWDFATRASDFSCLSLECFSSRAGDSHPLCVFVQLTINKSARIYYSLILQVTFGVYEKNRYVFVFNSDFIIL